jgi:hypothetical protein
VHDSRSSSRRPAHVPDYPTGHKKDPALNRRLGEDIFIQYLSLEGIPRGMFRFPDFWISLLAAAFPDLPVAILAAFVPSYSGGAVLDSHQLPCQRLQ